MVVANGSAPRLAHADGPHVSDVKIQGGGWLQE